MPRSQGTRWLILCLLLLSSVGIPTFAASPTTTSQPLASLYSIDAYRMEVRYLSRKLGEIDLKGPPIITDGWQTNIAEAEWPILTCIYFGHACLNLAEAKPALRQELLPEVRWVLHALQQPRLSGFVKPHFSEPFPKRARAAGILPAGSAGPNPNSAQDQLPPIAKSAVFVHGHFLYLALRYQSISGDQLFAPVIHQVATALARDFSATPHGILKSYSDMWWLTDNFAAYAGLARYDRLYGTHLSDVREIFLNEIRTHYLDPKTGLFATYVDAEHHQILQGPRGISMMYGLHFLKEFAPEFADTQYVLARKYFYRSLFGMGAMAEFAPGETGREDIDSGPVVFGLGPSASGFGIGAAAVMQDRRTVSELLGSLSIVGLPRMEGDELHYQSMPMVGQAVILFGKTAELVASKPN